MNAPAVTLPFLAALRKEQAAKDADKAKPWLLTVFHLVGGKHIPKPEKYEGPFTSAQLNLRFAQIMLANTKHGIEQGDYLDHPYRGPWMPWAHASYGTDRTLIHAPLDLSQLDLPKASQDTKDASA